MWMLRLFVLYAVLLILLCRRIDISLAKKSAREKKELPPWFMQTMAAVPA